MTREQFKQTLSGFLSAYSPQEAAEAISYYDEIICDRVENGEKEEDVIASFGDFTALAAGISAQISEDQGAKDCIEQEYSDLPENVTVRIRDNRVVVGVSLDGKVHVRYHESKFEQYECEWKDGDLTVRDKQKNVFDTVVSWFRFLSPVRRRPVGVLLPAEFHGDLTVRSGNGSVTAECLNGVGELNLHSSNGRVTCNHCTAQEDVLLHSSNGKIEAEEITAGNLMLKTLNGPILFKNLNARQKAELRTGNGRVEGESVSAERLILRSGNGGIFLLGADAKDVSAKTGNGKVDLLLSGMPSDYRIDCASGCGKIELQGLGITKQVINENGERKLEAKSGNGTISLKFQEIR